MISRTHHTRLLVGSMFVVLQLLAFAPADTRHPRPAAAHTVPAAYPTSTPEGGEEEEYTPDRNKADIEVYLRSKPRYEVGRGENIDYEVYLKNDGEGNAHSVAVDLYYDTAQIRLDDWSVDDKYDRVSSNQGGHLELIFSRVEYIRERSVHIVGEVLRTVPDGTVIPVWCQYRWHDGHGWHGKHDANGVQLTVVAHRSQVPYEAPYVPAPLPTPTPVPLPAPAPNPQSPPQPATYPGGIFFNPDMPPEQQSCFVETGFCIGGSIRDYWAVNGGLTVFGYPIAPQQEKRVEGQLVLIQWFERNRIEVHPDNPPPNTVMLGRLGVELLEQHDRSWFTFPTSGPLPGCRYFAETGHNICGDILARWSARGIEFDGQPGFSTEENIALFGLPISELSMETLSDGRQYQVQWFERARFEIHTEYAPPNNILLGLLGNEMW